tara:strand:- start:38 stop:892 length:855 start_codon:yes stop_codon:yes gene_type:complete
MLKMVLTLLTTVCTLLIGLRVWQSADNHANEVVWEKLVSHQPAAPPVFDPAMVSGLPEPAQRFLRFAIKSGTPLYTVAEVSMNGDFSLGDKTDPNYWVMSAEQILAAPHGFVWRLNARQGLVTISGADAAIEKNSWSRFWLMGVVPVARAGGNADHRRSAFGRAVAEAVFWTPAVLLPSTNVRWESIDESTARVTLTHLDLSQAVDVSVDPEGKATKVVFQRWSNANSEQVFRLQQFGGYLSEYREFGGYRLPSKIEAGNFFETPEYFPFFKATVSNIRFPMGE